MNLFDIFNEGLKDPKDNPCWKGYKPVGTKKKGGKTVPNCVPTNEGAEDFADIYSPEAIHLGKRFCDAYGLTDENDVQLAVELIDSHLEYARESGTPVNLNAMKKDIADAFRQVYRGLGRGPSFRKKFRDEEVEEGKVIQHKFGDRQAQRGKTPYYKNPDIEIPSYDPNLGRCWNSAYSDPDSKQPFDHFEVEPAGKSAAHIIGVTQEGKRVRCSTTSSAELANTLVDAYNRGGFTDKAIHRVPIGEQGVAEGTGNIGSSIKKLYQKIYRAGDDEIEYFYNDSPIFAQYWDEYEGDLDSIIAEVNPKELQVILDELESYVQQANLEEEWSKKYKSSIDCSHPKGFSQKAHCAGRNKKEDVTEFALAGGGDDGDDGNSNEALKRLAAQWYNGDEDPKVEKALRLAGWDIGQDEGYEDEPGVYVIQRGDESGDSFMSWPAEELRSINEARANTAGARAGLAKRKENKPLSPEEQAAKDKAKSDKWLEKERAKMAAKKGVAEEETGITRIDQDIKNLRETLDQDQVVDAIYNRLEQEHPDIVQKFGHEVVGEAVLDTAVFYQGVEELDENSLSEMVEHVLNTLRHRSSDQPVSENKLYYAVIGTPTTDLRDKFGLSKDKKGWYLKESALTKVKLEAFRAFGTPIIK